MTPDPWTMSAMLIATATMLKNVEGSKVMSPTMVIGVHSTVPLGELGGKVRGTSEIGMKSSILPSPDPEPDPEPEPEPDPEPASYST